MKKTSTIDYLSCIAFKLLGSLIRILPIRVTLFCGQLVGKLLYAFDFKHRAIVYANLKTAFGDKLSAAQIRGLSKEFYRSFGQSLLEIFFIPLIDKKYIAKYITIEGRKFIQEAFKNGQGVIFLGVHSGSWELSNIICANLGFSFNLFVRDQRYRHLDALLNSYRQQKGCKIIQRQNQVRGLIQALKNNEAIGMTADQGGKSGTLVKFFGRQASMPSGALRLALRYGAVILPALYTRGDGPYLKVIIEPPFKLKKTGNHRQDIQDNLQGLMAIFERLIRAYPKDYLWSYKIWKYAREKTILILNDAKVGHLRQSQAAAQALTGHLKDRGMSSKIHIQEVKLKNRLSCLALTFSSSLAWSFHCQGCLWCLRKFLQPETFESLVRLTPDFIISCGASLAAINYVLSRENLAKSILIMRFSFLSTSRFDLVIIPRHDRPPQRKNIVVTEGALNLINENYLKQEGQALQRHACLNNEEFLIGLLVGGNTKDFYLSPRLMLEVLSHVKGIAERYRGKILTTTSRRTHPEIESLLKAQLKDYPRSALLVVANEANLSFAVGGILALSKIVVVSPESISMVSEAATCGRYIIVFKGRVGLRHAKFLDYLASRNYIYLCEPAQIATVAEGLLKTQPPINTLKDNLRVLEGIKRII